MNAPVDVLQHRADADSKYGIIDCDVHPYPKAGALNKYLSERWRKHVAEYGQFTTSAYAARGIYPRFAPNTSRRDSWPCWESVPIVSRSISRRQYSACKKRRSA